MRILNGTFVPSANTCGYVDLARHGRQSPCNSGGVASTHLPVHTGVHTVKYWLVNCALVGRAKLAKKKGRAVVRGGKGRRKFHVRVGNLNKQTVRARFKNDLVSRKRNGGPSYTRFRRTLSRASASSNLRNSASITSIP